MLAPYMVTDEEYQRKRYGILGQLVNQGRALANYEVEEIIKKIKCRASSHELDRGLSLNLPYFNDQYIGVGELSLRYHPGREGYVCPSICRIGSPSARSESGSRYPLEPIHTQALIDGIKCTGRDIFEVGTCYFQLVY